MTPAFFNRTRLILAVLVLGAALVDLLLPSPHCGDPGTAAERVPRVGNTADACVASFPTAGDGLREP
jgi:hypothetical protein